MVNSTFGESVEKLYKGFRRRDVDVDAYNYNSSIYLL